jgi:large conductance mechanosensitive channel
MTGFKGFLLRGNLIDLGLAVVIGVAFNTLVQALINNLVTPFFAAIHGDHDFSDLAFQINGSEFHYGRVINAVIAFAVVVGVVYYLVVAPAGRLANRAERRAAGTDRQCPECLSEIPRAATRCRYCTAMVTPVARIGPEREPSATPLRSRLTWRPHS